jgi:REP element-mobilizing transposase RayT
MNKKVFMQKNRKRNRLKGYDYSQGGYYFITICINDRKNIFGTVRDSKCVLSDYGHIVKNILEDITKRYPYIELDYYVIMPNHIHVIIIINPIKPGNGKTKSLSEIIGAFKTMSSKNIHLKGLAEFKWQRSFYDRIIRNESELFLIRRYIEQNPLSLEIAKQFPENLDI